MKKVISLLLMLSTALLSAQQSIPPFSTPYGNFVTGLKLNGSYGTMGQCPVSTGTGTAWGACGGGSSFILTTIGTAGAATYTLGVLNIPVYSGGGGGGPVLQTEGVNNSNQGLLNLHGGAGINVDNSGGTTTITNTGSFNPPGTRYAWVGDSRLMISTFNQVTATAASGNGTTLTITLPNLAANWVDNTPLVAGDSIQFFNNANNWSPSCVAWGNATVLTASSTQVTVAENSLGPVTCSGTISGTGGVIQKANYLIPEAVGRESNFLGHGTTYNMGVPGQTTAGLASQYTTYIHPLSPAVTGQPGFLFIQAGSQNALNCDSDSTILTGLQNYWATAHADGWTIYMTGLITTGPTISCMSESTVSLVNLELRGQVKGYDKTLTTALKYWDQIVDINEYVGDLGDPYIFANTSEALHLNNGGTKTIAALMNLAMVSRGSIPPTPRPGMSFGERRVNVTGSFGAGRGFSTFANESWSGNTSSGEFSMGMDHAATGPTAGVGAFWLPNNVGAADDIGIGYGMNGQPAFEANVLGGYCWKNGIGGAFLSQQGNTACFKLLALNKVAFGNATSSTDASGQLVSHFILDGVTPGTSPVCPNGTGGELTTAGCVSGSQPTRTCNGNGCYRIASDGTIEAWGSVTITFTGATVGTGTITFPNTGGSAFTTTTNLALTVSIGASPSGSNDAVTAYYTGLTTSGASAVSRCSVNIGGSGCPNVTTTIPMTWHAIGN